MRVFVCEPGPRIVSGTRVMVGEEVPIFMELALKKQISLINEICFDNENFMKKMNQTNRERRDGSSGHE